MQNATATTARITVRPAAVATEVPGAEGRVYCRCSTDCKAATWNLFAQGHDAKLVSRLADEVVTTKSIDLEVAKGLVRKAGGDERLVAKLVAVVAKAHDRWTKRQEAAARKAAKAAAKVVEPKKVNAKVGRWVYEGTVADGKFRYTTKGGEAKVTTQFKLV